MQTSLWILFNTQRFYQQLSYLIIWYLIILTADQGQENKENERLDVRQEKAEKTFKSQTFTKTPVL